MCVDYLLDQVPDHVLDHMIIGLVTTALHQLTKKVEDCLLEKLLLSSRTSKTSQL